ncbi:MAG TPA: MacB family efflux pump subunit [Xanthomonadales bacterium]|nr:MacB family efflux pump subunit [Xanthomonadales bacterium]
MSSPALLSLRGVSRVYESGESEVRALDGIDLEIAAGEFVAIVGQSGSGKSTLLNVLGCLDRPTGGTYRVGGVDVSTLSADELAALRRDTFGFVFQRYNLLANATALENVEIPALYAGSAKRARDERAASLLDRLGLGDRARHRPSQLSGGQQQRVAIARALMNGAPVVLADEPTGALDSRSGKEVMEILKSLHAEGRTVLLITHDASVAANAHRIVELRDGKIVRDEAMPETAVPSALSPQPSALARGATATRALGIGIGESIKIALRALRANLFRTALTLLGVVIGVASVVAMLAIGSGSKADVLERIQAMGTNLLIVRPGAPGIRGGGGDVATLVLADAEAIGGIPGVESVSPERTMGAVLRAGRVDYRSSVLGVWPAYATARDWTMASGSFVTEDDVRSYAPVVVLGKTVATNLFPDGRDPVGSYVLVGNVPFEVIGVLAEKGAAGWGGDQDDVAMVPLSTGTMRLFGQPYLGGITVKVRDSGAIPDVEAAINAMLQDRHRTIDFQVRNTASLIETATETQDTLTVLLASIAAISLLVGGIGVMNIMLVSVTERTREIGIRMACGARRANILVQFNTEALVVCGVGGLIGVALGLATAAIAQRFQVPVAYSPLPATLAFSCAVLTGLLFGFLPARKASRLDPVAALAYE